MDRKERTPRRVGWAAALCAASVLGLVLALAPLAAGQDDELPEGPAKKIVQSACTQCHEIEMVTTQNFTKDQWSRTVDLMISRGAHLTPEQIPIVVAYLASNFGKPESSAGSSPTSGPAPEPAPGSAPSAAPLATSAPASATPAPSSVATTSAASPARAPTASAETSPAPAAAGKPGGGCTTTASAGAAKKKRKGFWGFLKKKPSGCAGRETATSANRGP